MFYPIKNKLTGLLFLIFLFPIFLSAQTEVIRNKKDGGYIFTIENQLAATPIKSQDRTGTCWSFSTVSFMESELLRMGKGEYNLSEMYVVRNIYPEKARLYVRMQGNSRFSAGGTFHDVHTVFNKFGMVPESVFPGRENGEKHMHFEMDKVLKSMCDALISNPNGTLSDHWMNAIHGVLDAYLGERPETFTYKGKSYTPQTFASSLGINTDDYVELSSFTHHPWYKKFVLEIPDNWDYNQVYNVPLDELVETINHALKAGYTVAWDADVSEKTFSHRNGVAIIPAANWNDLSANERNELFEAPSEELVVTPEIRQASFDNYETTDDHLMHIVGLAKDQNGKSYYMVKNSWGSDTNQCGGFVYTSEAYIRYKTIHILLHKDALSDGLREKLGL